MTLVWSVTFASTLKAPSHCLIDRWECGALQSWKWRWLMMSRTCRSLSISASGNLCSILFVNRPTRPPWASVSLATRPVSEWTLQTPIHSIQYNLADVSSKGLAINILERQKSTWMGKLIPVGPSDYIAWMISSCSHVIRVVLLICRLILFFLL